MENFLSKLFFSALMGMLLAWLWLKNKKAKQRNAVFVDDIMGEINRKPTYPKWRQYIKQNPNKEDFHLAIKKIQPNADLDHLHPLVVGYNGEKLVNNCNERYLMVVFCAGKDAEKIVAHYVTDTPEISPHEMYTYPAFKKDKNGEVFHILDVDSGLPVQFEMLLAQQTILRYCAQNIIELTKTMRHDEE